MIAALAITEVPSMMYIPFKIMPQQDTLRWKMAEIGGKLLIGSPDARDDARYTSIQA